MDINHGKYEEIVSYKVERIIKVALSETCLKWS